MSRRLALGLDFGTESVRALLVDCTSGELVGTAVRDYPHGVMDQELAGGGPALPPDFALQHPEDYLAAAEAAVTEARERGGAGADDVVGIGVDFTACTMLPVDADLRPLCLHEEFRGEPHAWVKLWKHHGANPEAAAINRSAAERGEKWLERYGGTTSSEWMLAKAWETLRRAPEVYRAADRYLEASDWVVAKLTGEVVRGACAAGYKGMWHGRDGWVGDGFLAALDPQLAGFSEQKMRGRVAAAGTRAGALTAEAAGRLGLSEGVAVSPAIIDAHAAVPGCGVTGAGQLVIILGTSSCHMLLGEREVLVPGIQGVVEEGILPGFFGYEAGQAASGDILDWYVDRLLGHGGAAEAEAHRRLTEEAAGLAAGSTGLLVLDWWNGNRSVLINPELSGAIFGLTKNTSAAEIYRALIEGTAFGTCKILENFQEHGVPVREVFVCGGIAEKNELLLQVYADVTGRELRRAGSPQVCALGAAIFGAVAAGAAAGGHDRVEDAVAAMVPESSATIHPTPGENKVYRALYRHWERLHDHFGRGGHDVMPFLRSLRSR